MAQTSKLTELELKYRQHLRCGIVQLARNPTPLIGSDRALVGRLWSRTTVNRIAAGDRHVLLPKIQI
jgi:hypothetical protein